MARYGLWVSITLFYAMTTTIAYSQEAYTFPVYRGLNLVTVKAMSSTTGVVNASDFARVTDATFVARLVPARDGERSRFDAFIPGLGSRDFAIERGGSMAYMIASTSERVIEIDTRIPTTPVDTGDTPTSRTFTVASGSIVLIRDANFDQRETLLTILNPVTGAVVGKHLVPGFVADHLDRRYLYASRSIECEGRGIIVYDYTAGRETRITNSSSALAERQCDSMVADVSPVPQAGGTVAFVRSRLRATNFQTGYSIQETNAQWTAFRWWTEDTVGARYSFPVVVRSGPRVYALYEETIFSPQGTASGYKKPQIIVITGPFTSSVLTSFGGGVLSYDVNAAGTQIVFSAKESESSSAEVYTMSQDGSGRVQLTNNAVNDRSPVFSADETKIIFVSDRDTGGAVHDMSVDGSGARLLYRPSFGEGGFLRVVQ